MELTDEQLDTELKELEALLNPKAIEKIRSHLMSIANRIKEARNSRDSWKNKYSELKK